MGQIAIAQRLPSLSLASTEGREVRLPEDWFGKWTVLYFYPKDEARGCIEQACAFRDKMGDFDRLGARVYGVSLDDLSTHRRFTARLQLNFPLLVDENHQLSQALGVYAEQQCRGMRYMGLSRDTFLVDPHGRIREVLRNVDPVTNAEHACLRLQRHLPRIGRR